jgi:hypothetical protein
LAKIGTSFQIQRLDVRDDREVAVTLRVDARHPLRPLDVPDPGNDADLGQVSGNHRAALAGVRGRRQPQGQFEGRLDARPGQQGSCPLRIVGVDAGGVDVAERTLT